MQPAISYCSVCMRIFAILEHTFPGAIGIFTDLHVTTFCNAISNLLDHWKLRRTFLPRQWSENMTEWRNLSKTVCKHHGQHNSYQRALKFTTQKFQNSLFLGWETSTKYRRAVSKSRALPWATIFPSIKHQFTANDHTNSDKAVWTMPFYQWNGS